ncbi:uncharacterized protein PV06_10993 [Exophiala oligosperma]|uniref:Uncharacterized protein n=1 Tax=Exophiala oligosperma TaxID=215243 RepID=A0A0D2DMC9_9EURO|nr:uncharacterized protein PV06_10993 [Exophiala oligosperma]KIW36879.1 hypothetical protein PV06_10993 [Exophiala oligosperma]
MRAPVVWTILKPTAPAPSTERGVLQTVDVTRQRANACFKAASVCHAVMGAVRADRFLLTASQVVADVLHAAKIQARSFHA